MNEIRLIPCPLCGHERARIIGKAEHRPSANRLVAYEWVPDSGFGGNYEREITVLDFRFGFYVRCNKCGAKGPVRKTPWHVRTEEEVEDWSHDCKYFGFDKDSEFARPAREAAAAAWNRRAERTCHYVEETRGGETVWACSECGGLEPVCDDPKYCIDCGAKVVEK